MDFPHEVRFSAGNGPAHFPAETTRPLGLRLSAIFTYLLQCFTLEARNILFVKISVIRGLNKGTRMAQMNTDYDDASRFVWIRHWYSIQSIFGNRVFHFVDF